MGIESVTSLFLTYDYHQAFILLCFNTFEHILIRTIVKQAPLVYERENKDLYRVNASFLPRVQRTFLW